MSSSIWELDFYSRPIIDENNKKYWEVLICESPNDVKRSPENLFRFAKYCNSKQVNSIWLKSALEEAIKSAKTTPKKIRFFRRQMNNMIVKACDDAGITAIPSRRTYALNSWIAHRMEFFYPNESGYDAKAANSQSVMYPDLNAIPLPDAIRGDKSDRWSFVSLEASAFEEMPEWDISFGEFFPLSLANITPETKIPGLIIFSPRAIPLAAWMSGLEMGYLDLEITSRPRLRLETGSSDSWILVELTNDRTKTEAKEFSESKSKANGVHFVAIQSHPKSESFAGFWLLKS